MGNKNNNITKKTSGQELSDEELDLLIANTDMDRFMILEWYDGFIKV